MLFHNNGDGTFRQVSGPTTIGRTPGKALGVVATDINNDGLIDLIVANDTSPNFLFLNQGKNVWRENGVAAGIAFSASGNLRSGMGVDAADFNGDGWQDVFIANIDHEMFSLYESHAGAFFTDAAPDHGLAQATRLLSGWGASLADFDNDGFVDLLIANGHPDDTIASRAPDVSYKEPLLLFRHDGRRLRNVSRDAGPVFAKTFAARGLAVGDFDNDGRARRPRRLQRRRARAAAQLGSGRASLGGRQAAGRALQPRRDRREAHVVGRRRAPLPAEERRRQLPVVARSARGARSRPRHRGRLAGGDLAGAGGENRTVHERPGRSLRHDRRGQGNPGVTRILPSALLALAFVLGCGGRPPQPPVKTGRRSSARRTA